MDTPRKSSQEVEIDHLLAEEFSCDPSFARNFITGCGLQLPSFQVTEALPEPSLGGNGYGDVLVIGRSDGLDVALLIEDKITASPGVRQANRYREHAKRMISDGYNQVWCILVAPAAYRGERPLYDYDIDLEDLKFFIGSPEQKRRVVSPVVV